jgi:hypothetical protein
MIDAALCKDRPRRGWHPPTEVGDNHDQVDEQFRFSTEVTSSRQGSRSRKVGQLGLVALKEQCPTEGGMQLKYFFLGGYMD